MAFSYSDTKEFSPEELEELFLSVQWESGRHPERLAKALLRYGSVFSAWEGGKLAGLAAAMDDGAMTAMFITCWCIPGARGVESAAACWICARSIMPAICAWCSPPTGKGYPFMRGTALSRTGRRRPCASLLPLPGKQLPLPGKQLFNRNSAGEARIHGVRLRNGCMRHMVAVRHSHSSGPYRK